MNNNSSSRSWALAKGAPCQVPQTAHVQARANQILVRPNRFLVQVQGSDDHPKQDCKGKVVHVHDLVEPSNLLQKSDGKIDRGLPGHFPGQDRRDQGKEENCPENQGIPACGIVHDQIHRIDPQDGAFLKMTRTPQLAV